MGFSQLGQEWKSYIPKGTPRHESVRIGIGQWAWVEREPGESGLCPVGEVVTIEQAIRLEDENGDEIPGALERATMWEVIASRRGLPTPKQQPKRKPKRTKRTKLAAISLDS